MSANTWWSSADYQTFNDTQELIGLCELLLKMLATWMDCFLWRLKIWWHYESHWLFQLKLRPHYWSLSNIKNSHFANITRRLESLVHYLRHICFSLATRHHLNKKNVMFAWTHCHSHPSKAAAVRISFWGGGGN